MSYKDKEKARAYRREWNKKWRAEHKDYHRNYLRERRRKKKEFNLICKRKMKLIGIYSDGIKYGYAVFQGEGKIKIEEYTVGSNCVGGFSFLPTLKSYTLESDEENLGKLEITNIQEFCNSATKIELVE